MYLAFGNPHDPRVAAEKYMELYDRDKIPLPKNFLPLHPFNNGEQFVRDELLAALAADRGRGPPALARLLRRDHGHRRPHRPLARGARRTAACTTTRSSSSRPITAWRSAATACSASRTCTTPA